MTRRSVRCCRGESTANIGTSATAPRTRPSHRGNGNDACRGVSLLGMRNDFSRRMGLPPNTFDRGAIGVPRPHTVKKCAKDSTCGGDDRPREGYLRVESVRDWADFASLLPSDYISINKLSTPETGLFSDVSPVKMMRDYPLCVSGRERDMQRRLRARPLVGRDVDADREVSRRAVGDDQLAVEAPRAVRRQFLRRHDLAELLAVRPARTHRAAGVHQLDLESLGGVEREWDRSRRVVADA